MFKPLARKLPNHLLIGVAGAVALATLMTIIDGSTTWPILVVSAVIAGITSFTAIFLLDRQDARLASRVTDDASCITWDVWMNDCKIGLIHDAQYAQMQRFAFRDGRMLFAQVLNLSRVALNIATKGLVGVPLMMFWLLVIASLPTTESITEIAATWQTAGLASIMDSLRFLFSTVVMLYVLSVGFMFAFGYRFGFRNCYAEAVARMIRRHLNMPIEGDMRLSKTLLV
jgi:hypothetical protein